MKLSLLCPILSQTLNLERKLLFNACRTCITYQHARRTIGCIRLMSSSNEKHKNELTAKTEQGSGEVSTTLHTVKETTKTVSYTGVILVGVGVTGILFYTVFRELFSGKSPNSVYTKAFDRCINDTRIRGSLGEPIKGYGEETRRGRRGHVSHLLYEKNGVNFLRMKFYVQGSRRKATVHLEMRENTNGSYEYRYLFVQLDDFPHSTFVLEDNRLGSPEPEVELLPITDGQLSA